MRCLLLSAALIGLAVSSSAHAASALLLVVDRDGDALVVVDPATKKVRARVAVGHSPHEVAASADGKLAFVANYGDATPGSSLSVVDLETAKELRRVDLGAFRRPHGLAVVEGTVYFTAEMNRAVGRYDPKTDKVDRIVGLGREGTHMIVASPDGKALYTTDIGSGSVSVIRRDTGKIALVSVGGHPEGLAISPDGREVWAGQREGGEVAIIDTEKNVVKATITLSASMAARLRFTPDGKRVLVPDPQSDLLIVVDARTHKEAAKLSLAGAPLGVVTDPEGRFAYVGLAGEKKVAVIDLNDLTVTSTFDVGQIADGMGWAVAPSGPK
ncbi:MAG: beta-propeller repeat protein [Planctomycetota bacterium]|nr:beta-propeller repeat protein [Planctomycetota bacterium]